MTKTAFEQGPVLVPTSSAVLNGTTLIAAERTGRIARRLSGPIGSSASLLTAESSDVSKTPGVQMCSCAQPKR